ncbi:MAG: non-canonical purine NTP pyrophosphatase [Candidatus Saccharibacteria bacterium]
MNVIFVTGNERKIRHMREACALFDITVDQRVFDIDEIQSDDPLEISKHKAEQAFKMTGGRPTVSNDAFWNIPALNGFPGGYMKDVMQWFTTDDWLRLMANKTDRRICCTETLIYKDATQTKLITKEYWFEVATSARGEGPSLEQIVLIDGKTIAESHQYGRHALDVKKYIWYDFAEWFAGTAV